MSIKQQLEQVIAYAHKEAEVACVHHRYYAHLEEIASRLYAIVEQMEKVEPVAWVNPVALEQVQEFDCVQILFYRRGHNHSPGDMGRIPLYATPQVPDGLVLVPEVLLRQISKWLAESADPYDKAAYAINGLIAAAKEEGSAS